MSAAPYFEIGAASNFSFLRGASHPEEMVEAAHALGLSGLALADRNTVAGVVRMHAAAKAKGLEYRAGACLVFDDDTPDMLALPIDRQGWGHLCRLLSAGKLRSEKGTCRLYRADLLEWGGNLLLAVIPPSLGTAADAETFRMQLEPLVEAFADRLYLALVPRHDGRDSRHFVQLAAISQGLCLRLIATNLPAYHEPQRKPLADIVTAIREHVTVEEAGLRLAANGERHLKSPDEMAHLMRRYPQALQETARFFARLGFSLDELCHQYPEETVDGETPAKALRRLTYEGAARRFPKGLPEKVADLLEYELTLIADKRYEPYFLTVWRIVTHARSINILCQGRGSAANSAVCFCLGITEVNPEQTTLLFDRFISTERDEPPDIDVDFEHEKREDVIKFIYEEYGQEHAALTAAVISYRTRSAGREVAKAFGLSDDVQSALSSSVWGWWTSGVGEDQAKAAGLDVADPTTRRVMHYAGLLQGFPRHLSQHVGGFVITRDRLDEVVPIMKTADGRYMIEWDKDDLDTLKILKIDVLALGMLTCLAKALALLETHYGRRETLASILNDHRPEVYDMICRADTIGVFQIESRAQMSMLPRLKPRRFYDLVIEVAIVRPGPIQGNMVHPYLKRRQELARGRQPTYPKEELKVVLERTLGVPLFQEQAMQIAITGAGFTPSEADLLRRAMATFRRTGQVSHFRQRFIDGMVARGYEQDFAERCFSQIEGFGEYGFPESHAASFALLVYVSCWFKAFYPDVFCAAMLNSQPMGFYAPAQLVRDAREHGVAIRAVDINASGWDSSLEDLDRLDEERAGRGSSMGARLEPRHRSMRDVIRTRFAVRLGFSMIKGLSEQDALRLAALRGDGYHSVEDLWRRAGVSRAVMEKLADADAFGSLGISRRAALWAVRALEDMEPGSIPLFDRLGGKKDIIVEPAFALPEMAPGEEVIEDYRTLTLSLKAHPVSFLRRQLAERKVTTARELDLLRGGRMLDVAGLVLVRQRPGSAKGVIFMTLEDETGVVNVIVWPKVFETYRAIVMGARLVRVRGRLQNQEGVIHVVATHLEDMTASLRILQARSPEVVPDGTIRRAGAEDPAGTEESHRRQADLFSNTVAAQAMPKGRNFH